MKRPKHAWMPLLWMCAFLNGMSPAADDAPVVLYDQGFPTTGKRQEWNLPQSAVGRLIHWPSKESTVSVALERVRALSEARWAERMPGRDVRIASIALQKASHVSQARKAAIGKEWEDRWFYVVMGTVVSKSAIKPADEMQLTVVILGDSTILEPVEREFFNDAIRVETEAPKGSRQSN